MPCLFFLFFFFFNDTATTEIYTLSLHDALPICFSIAYPARWHTARLTAAGACLFFEPKPFRIPPNSDFTGTALEVQDRKSTRLNSSHANISYAVFCLKKKKKKNTR